MAIINTLDCTVCKRFFGYRLAISWLLAGYRLTISLTLPKINTIQYVVMYYYVPNWHMAAINTLDCSVFTRPFGYRLAIGWLLAGYGPNSIQSKRYIHIYYYIPKLDMAASNTLDCSTFIRFLDM